MSVSIPPKTISDMHRSYGKGERHAGMLALAIQLLGNGMAPDAVRAQLRATFPDADKSDKEIADVVDWCVGKNPTPSGYGKTNGSSHPAPVFRPKPAAPDPVAQLRSPAEHAAWWLGDITTTEQTMIDRSPEPISPMRPDALFSTLYQVSDCISIVTNFLHDEAANKARPVGAGKTLARDEWIAWFQAKGVPQSDAGGWMRPNPVTLIGTGKGGAPQDADVTAFRFLLVESDTLPLATQLALYAHFPLPVAAVILSGGSSAHAWVRVECGDADEYETVCKRLLVALAPFGIDKANKNPSRLSRLPGAVRKIGAAGDGCQKLLHLNPSAPPLRDLAEVEAILSAPIVDEKPFKSLFQRAIVRYGELQKNRGKLGVPTGIHGLDAVSGGLKSGQMIIVAAETGGGKSTVALNIVNHAAKAGYGIALFSMEMDRDEIFDILVSMNAEVNRNTFNTGNFTEGDSLAILRAGEMIAKLPIWIVDDAVITIAQIRARALQLMAAQKISLLVIDYIQFITPDAAFRDNREQQIATISRGIRSLAKELKVPILALSQLNDEGKIRESRVIAHDAHIVILIEQAEDDMLAKVVKGRSIPKGEHLLQFEPHFCRLTYRETGQTKPQAKPEKRKYHQ